METYRLPEIPHLRLRCTLRSQERAHLPAYKGSLLRGAFGQSLRRLVCTMGPEQPCTTCSSRHSCIHAYLFEGIVDPQAAAYLHGQPAQPLPYLFEPTGEGRELEAGETLDFDLVLFGRAVSLQASALLAIERMAHQGLGAGRHPFELQRVRYQDQDGRWISGYERGERRWQDVDALSVGARELHDSRLRLRFLTPTRIKEKGRFLATFTFPILAFRMLRRSLEIAHFHVEKAELDWDLDSLLHEAAAVRITRQELRWHDWQRYSNRQKTKMSLGGVLGELTLEGPLRIFHPMLQTAELVHIGKGTTFGLGRIKVE